MNWLAKYIGFFGTFMRLLLSDPPAPSDVLRDREVPAAALEAAQKCLDDDWRVRCAANPIFYGLKDAAGVSTAELRPPFVEYILRGDELSEYAASSSYDPRPFATLTKYMYPIAIAEDFVGGLVVLANHTEDGSIIDSTQAHTSYVCTSFYPANGGGKMEEYRRTFPVTDGYVVEFVRIVGGTTNVMVTDRAGEMFILEDEALVPLSLAGNALKAMAVTANELRLRGIQLQVEE